MIWNKKGQSVVEIVVAMAILVLVLPSIVVLYLGAGSSNLRDTEFFRADMFLQEGVEAVRSIRDYDFSNLTVGTHGLSDTSGYWQFSGSSDTWGEYTRTVIIANSLRDSSCDLVDTGGSADVNTKKVTVTVDWELETANDQSMSTTFYVSDLSTSVGCEQAGSLTINAGGAYATGGNKQIAGITLSNTGSSSITIASITPDWSNSSNIEAIDINGTRVWGWVVVEESGYWAGTPTSVQAAGSEINIVDVTISAGATINVDWFYYDANMNNTSNNWIVTMSDGSIRYVEFDIGPAAPDTTAPDAVADLATTGSTTTSIDLSWTAPGDDGAAGTATTYDIRYSTSTINDGNWASATAVTGEPSPSFAGLSESMTVSGLSAGTTYYFAMKTSDEVPNESLLSNVANGTTAAAATEASYFVVDVSSASIGGGGDKEIQDITIENTSGSNITIDKIKVTWTNGQLIEEIRIDGNRKWKHDNEGSPDGRQSTGTELDIDDFALSGGATYDIDKFKFDGDMTGDSFTITFTMSDASTKVVLLNFGGGPSDTTAPADVSELSASTGAGTSIDLSWTAPGDDGTTGTATTYDVRYSTSTINAGNWAAATQASGEPSPSVAGSSESMTVNGLSSSTTYYFAIKTSDEVLNESGLSNVDSATTATPSEAGYLVVDISSASIGGGGDKELQDITVENISGSNITIDKITVTWTNGQLIEEFKIDGNRKWKHNNEGSPSGRQPTGTELDIDDFALSGGATYEIDKFKFNGDMDGDTFTITFTMDDGSTKLVTSFSP